MATKSVSSSTFETYQQEVPRGLEGPLASTLAGLLRAVALNLGDPVWGTGNRAVPQLSHLLIPPPQAAQGKGDSSSYENIVIIVFQNRSTYENHCNRRTFPGLWL